jgi:hypothetical protein
MINNPDAGCRSGAACTDFLAEEFMKYMLLVYLDEKTLSDAERQECYVKSAEVARDLHVTGQLVDASPLQPTAMATSIRVRDGRRLVTDGPFAETREQLGGFFMIEAANLDDALSVASRIPAAKFGTIEVRPLLPISGLPGQ